MISTLGTKGNFLRWHMPAGAAIFMDRQQGKIRVSRETPVLPTPRSAHNSVAEKGQIIPRLTMKTKAGNVRELGPPLQNATVNKEGRRLIRNQVKTEGTAGRRTRGGRE